MIQKIFPVKSAHYISETLLRKTHMKNLLFFSAIAFLFCSCNKMKDSSGENIITNNNGFINYTIKKGNHFCEGNDYKAVETTEMKFVVKFDSTAIYQTISAQNQFDINKLFGFADNDKDHHQFSARFGWRWSDNALRLFAYVYNDGIVISKELTSVAIGAETVCTIKITGAEYLFTVNDMQYKVLRTSTTEKAKGYQLYPYFGGDEVAPHEINVFIKKVE